MEEDLLATNSHALKSELFSCPAWSLLILQIIINNNY